MLDSLRADAHALALAKDRPVLQVTLEALVVDSGFQAVVLYRLASVLRALGVPILGHVVTRLGQLLTGAEISPNARIGGGLRVSHGSGLVVGGGVRIGARAHLHHGVTLGARNPTRLERMPVLGDDVFVAAGATVLGAVTIGDGAVIGAHALVLCDVPASALALSTPAEIRLPGGPRGGDPEGVSPHTDHSPPSPLARPNPPHLERPHR